MRYTFSYLILLFFFLSCGNDDSGIEPYDPCLDYVEISEVTMTDVILTPVNDGNQYGYIVTAIITNNTDTHIQGGRTNINFYVNGIPRLLGGIAICGYIDANSNCEYEYYWELDSNENFDQNPIIACYYYEL